MMGYHRRSEDSPAGNTFTMTISASQEFPSVPASEQGREETRQARVGHTSSRPPMRSAILARWDRIGRA